MARTAEMRWVCERAARGHCVSASDVSFVRSHTKWHKTSAKVVHVKTKNPYLPFAPQPRVSKSKAFVSTKQKDRASVFLSAAAKYSEAGICAEDF